VGSYLVLVPEDLLGAGLGDVVGGLADEAALPRPHPGNPQRVLRPPGAALLVLLEHALLVLLALLLGAVGGRGRLRREEVRVRLPEALPRLSLPLVRHLWLRLPLSRLLATAGVFLGGGGGGRGVGEGCEQEGRKGGDEGFSVGGVL